MTTCEKRRENMTRSGKRLTNPGKGLETLCYAPKANEKNIEGLKSQMASDAKAIAHMTTLLKDYRWNSFRTAAENGKLRRSVSVIKEKTLETLSSAK